MYPNLYYLIKDIFGISIPPLKIVNMFGLCVALSFLAAAWLLVKELKRRQALGIFTYTEKNITVGAPVTNSELALNFFLGFILGFKFLGIFLTSGALLDPQGFIFSGQGNWLAGIILGGLFIYLKWHEKNKVKLAKPEERTIRIWPSDRVGDMTIIAAIAGFIGAKIFDNLENWDRFVKDPIGNLFSASGLTFYGGLICAAAALWYYFRKHNIRFIDVADAISPALMTAYGLGRLGCQIAGDGDWGIANTHPKPFGWLPNWMWAYDYPHNVVREDTPMFNCTWDDFCYHLKQPVFPTPFYEVVTGLLLAIFLWRIRKKVHIAGRLFAIYLFVNGIERLLIEQIRVNTKYTIFGFHPTQAEIIATLLIISGIVLYIQAPKWFAKK
ncbi:MAG: prolipoprotein diacylglyceryl transferase [Chitinophagaceae bacterium]|jgi:prolipoprotein diacylglyceryl transferase|nr:prolipoprotein diacylglyceryl transferase [Chitinophagaceae bacterium]